MASTDILIHPGFHKTGTTFLQNVLFSGAAGFAQPWSRAFIDEHLMRPHPLAFDRDAARARFAAEAAQASGLCVLSEEGLGGNPFNGAREAKANADKLAATFDHARVLITIRRQQDMIRSVYIQYLKAGGRRTLHQFLSDAPEPEFFTFDADIFHYDRLVLYYERLFGAGSVLVMPQEYLRRDVAAATALIGAHVGVLGLVAPAVPSDRKRDNLSPPLASAPLLRHGNRFASGPFNETASFPGPLAARGLRSLGYRQRGLFTGLERRLRAHIETTFAGHFAESNRHLQALAPVPLAEFRYDL